MNIFEIILISISLSMDAFSISLCKGMTLSNNKYKKSFCIGLYFGLFQFIMPIIGYLLSSKLSHLIVNIDHWIAFLLLLIIGLKMIKDSILNEDNFDDNIRFRIMIPLAIATSIDALAIGVSFSILNINIMMSSLFIGIVTFILSFIGTIIGNNVGKSFGNKSQCFGGFILIVIAFKILFEHLGLI